MLLGWKKSFLFSITRIQPRLDHIVQFTNHQPDGTQLLYGGLDLFGGQLAVLIHLIKFSGRFNQFFAFRYQFR
jgi:hypothetical protein